MTQAAERIRVSVSSERAFQRCEMRYFLRYIRRLKRRTRGVPQQLGIMLHEYMEIYYKNLKRGRSSYKSHRRALKLMLDGDVRHEIITMAELCRQLGQIEVAKGLLELPERAKRLAERYYEKRGGLDAERFEVLFVEQEIELDFEDSDRLYSVSFPDLITRERETGRISLWEHKSTENVPSGTIRLLDLQTVVYSDEIVEALGITIDDVIWNYVRTKEPQVPDLVYVGTKREGLTKRADLDTTWETYLAEVTRRGLDFNDYMDVAERLLDDDGNDRRWLTHFFPRFEMPIMVEAHRIVNDYIHTAFRIEAFHDRVEQGGPIVRSLARDCDWCDMLDICRAELTGGDIEDVIKMVYKQSERPLKEDAIKTE